MDAVTDSNKYTHIDPDIYPNWDKHRDANFYLHRYIYAYNSGNADSECDGNRFPNIHSNGYADCDLHEYSVSH